MKFNLSLVIILLLTLTSCARKDILVIGEVYPEIEVDTVAVYLMDKPACDFNVIATIKIPGDIYSQSGLVNSFKSVAADLGAPIIQVTSSRKINVTEYMGTARALRCVPIRVKGFDLLSSIPSQSDHQDLL